MTARAVLVAEAAKVGVARLEAFAFAIERGNKLMPPDDVPGLERERFGGWRRCG